MVGILNKKEPGCWHVWVILVSPYSTIAFALGTQCKQKGDKQHVFDMPNVLGWLEFTLGP